MHGAEDLTILHVVTAERPVDAGNPIPHNHLMWALIGVTHGSEENEFFRRSARTIEPSGDGRVIAEGEVLMMGDKTIHSVKNPSSARLSSAVLTSSAGTSSPPRRPCGAIPVDRGAVRSLSV